MIKHRRVSNFSVRNHEHVRAFKDLPASVDREALFFELHINRHEVIYTLIKLVTSFSVVVALTYGDTDKGLQLSLPFLSAVFPEAYLLLLASWLWFAILVYFSTWLHLDRLLSRLKIVIAPSFKIPYTGIQYRNFGLADTFSPLLSEYPFRNSVFSGAVSIFLFMSPFFLLSLLMMFLCLSCVKQSYALSLDPGISLLERIAALTALLTLVLFSLYFLSYFAPSPKVVDSKKALDPRRGFSPPNVNPIITIMKAKITSAPK